MTSILETAKQVVEWRALAKTSGDLGKDGFARVRELIKLGFPETICKNEAGIAAALVEAEVYISRLLAICQRYGVANHIGIDMHSQELIDLRTYRNARAFLSRISKEQDNASS